MHMGIFPFRASVPFTTRGKTLLRPSRFNLWHRRTPQMYIVVGSDPSRQDRDASSEGIISTYEFYGRPRSSSGLTHRCSRNRRVYRVHQDFYPMGPARVLQARVMLIRREGFFNGHQTQTRQRWDLGDDGGEERVRHECVDLKSDVHQSFRKGGQWAAPEWPGDDELLQLGKEVSETGSRLAGKRQGCDGWPVSGQ